MHLPKQFLQQYVRHVQQKCDTHLVHYIIIGGVFTGMKLAQKYREPSRIPHGKLGRRVP